jgi:hypothetical protein
MHTFKRLSFLLACVSLIVFSQQAIAQTSSKVIKDPAEYNAYMAALNDSDPLRKAAAMEAFVKQYPGSIVKTDALEQAMASYQAAGNVAKVEETANQLLQLDPNNIRALAIITFVKRASATASGDAKAAQEVGLLGLRGLNGLSTWTRPEGLSDSVFEKLKNQMAQIFNGAVGFAALRTQDYARARQYLLESVQLNPENMEDVYQLTIAELEVKPVEPDGFWYAAKAFNLARSQNNLKAGEQIQNYAKARYHNYHGSDDGWDKLVAAANQSMPPKDFASSISRAPTPAELAVKAVQENDPASLSFSDWEFILSFRDASPANKQAAERIWQAIQALEKDGAAKLKIQVKVISATKDTIRAAITDENEKANIADLEITMEGAMSNPPIAGSEINVIGIIKDYKVNPFTFIMTSAVLP